MSHPSTSHHLRTNLPPLCTSPPNVQVELSHTSSHLWKWSQQLCRVNRALCEYISEVMSLIDENSTAFVCHDKLIIQSQRGLKKNDLALFETSKISDIQEQR